MPEDFNTPNKVCIRNNYNKVLIKHLKEKYGYDIVYFGLPSPEAQDVECWLEYISYVIAFQCRDYKQVSDPDLPTDEIDKLIEKLNTWESASKIDGYVVYDGFMEEVIFNGQDNSSSGSVQFSFDQAVTLFNLDFCNKITSPQEYRDSDGVYVKKHKFELIDKILEFQKGVSADNQRFVLFLTINAGYDGAELSEYCTVNHDELTVYNQCSKEVKKQFVLKHFVESVLFEKFCSKEFIPYFLPTVFYNGISGVNMIQFAIMCINPEDKLRSAGVFMQHQKKQEIVNRHPIVPDCVNDTFVNYEHVVDGMNDSNVDFMNTFCSSSTHKKYWVQKD